MNPAQHTPGPWRPVKATKPNPWWTVLSDSRDVCDVAVEAHVWNNPKALAQVEANARLIAAAPELLAALERIANMGPDSEPENDYDDMEGAESYGVSIAAWEAAEIARAAIAKAKEGAS